MTASTPTHPSHIAQFELLRRIGAGGMAEVFLARKKGAENTYKTLVVKRILPSYGRSRRFRTMFIEEAQLATRLNHPNIVQVYEFFDAAEDGHVLSMEYVEGADLGRLLTELRSRDRRLDPWLAAWVVGEAAKGLHYAHERRDEGGVPLEIVHRDVSPQNILLSYDGGVKLADFGIATARMFEDEQGLLKGKFAYMSPEQARAERVDRRSDLYALGAILWECLAGRPIHGSVSGEALLDVIRGGNVASPRVHDARIPVALERIVMTLCDRDRDRRYASARDVSAAITKSLFEEQRLVDSSDLEALMTEVIPRSVQSTEPEAQPMEVRTQAAGPLALNASAPPLEEANVTHSGRPILAEAREVRHVALVSLRLDVDATGPRSGALVRSLERLRTMLGEIAYKHGARWSWTNDLEALAVTGLSSRASQALADAAELALDTSEAVLAVREDLPVPLAPRVSIVRGIASGARDRSGNLSRYTMNEAALVLSDRVLAAAPPDAIWVAGGVYRLLARDFVWSEVAEIAIGEREGHVLPHAVRVYALERSLSREERAARPLGLGDFVGRDAERQALASTFERATSLGGDAPAGMHTLACVVCGELGIGKTALVNAFTSELGRQVRVIRVASALFSRDAPLATITDLLRQVIGVRATDPHPFAQERFATLLGPRGDGGAARRLADIAISSQRPGDEEETAHFQKKPLIAALRQLGIALGHVSPVVLVFDAFQHVDSASLEILNEWTRAKDAAPLLFLFVTRPDDRVLPHLDATRTVQLSGMSEGELRRLLEVRLGVKAGVEAVCAELAPRVGGNPFYLLEIVDALLEKGTIDIRGEALVRASWAEEGFQELPSTLEQLLADRIEELPGPERILVDWLAVSSSKLPENLLLRLTKDHSNDALLGLYARGLCDRIQGEVDFRHPLTREVAYAALEPLSRVRLHRELGELLSGSDFATGIGAAVVARHLAKGEVFDRAGELYLVAARAARTQSQSHLAVRYLKHALSYLPRDHRARADAYAALEALFRLLGKRDERIRHLALLRRTARQSRIPRVAALALTRTARLLYDDARLAEGRDLAMLAASAARIASDLSLVIEAELLLGDFARELGDVQGALAATDRALAALESSKERVPSALRGEVLRTRGVLLRRVGRVREAVDHYAEAIALFCKAGARRQEARAKNALAYAMFVEGRYEDAIALALQSIRVDLSIGGRFELAKTLANIGQAYGRLGDLGRSIAYLDRAREAHERYRDREAYADTLLVMAAVLLDHEELERAEPLLEAAERIVAVSNNAYDRTHALIVRAAMHIARGQYADAARVSVEARRLAEPQALVAYHFYATALEAVARAALGEVHAAALLASTALGAVENLQGCEYGLEVRILCHEVLAIANSPESPALERKTVEYISALVRNIRDARYKRSFLRRPLLAKYIQSVAKANVSSPRAGGAS